MPVHGAGELLLKRHSPLAGSIVAPLMDGPEAPDIFEFTAQSGVTASALITSNTITLSGTGAWTISSAGDGSPQISINGGTFTATPTATVSNGDTLAVRLTASANSLGENVAVIQVGIRKVHWLVATGVTSAWSMDFSVANDSGYVALLEDI